MHGKEQNTIEQNTIETEVAVYVDKCRGSRRQRRSRKHSKLRWPTIQHAYVIANLKKPLTTSSSTFYIGSIQDHAH